MLWVLAVTTIRASIIILYIHIFPNRIFRNLCHMTLALQFLFLTGTVMADCLICRPIAYHWDQTIEGGSCGDQNAFSIYVAILNLLQDVLVVLLPMHLVWNLNLALHKKVGVSCIFGLGLMYDPLSPGLILRIWLICIHLQHLRCNQLPSILHRHRKRPWRGSGSSLLDRTSDILGSYSWCHYRVLAYASAGRKEMLDPSAQTQQNKDFGFFVRTVLMGCSEDPIWEITSYQFHVVGHRSLCPGATPQR